jgi:hypothetical protein
MKPILFSTPMVEAILAGRKTMTRRVVKLKHTNGHEVKSIQKDGSGTGWVAWSLREVSAEETARLYPGEEGFKCPYGNPGDLLWVRETWQYVDLGPGDENNGYVYKASENGQAWAENDESWKWRPSLFMPRDACRLFLKITNVRIEKLQAISWQDIISEGIETEYSGIEGIQDLEAKLENLWQKINGKESWDANPWVWVIEFEPTEKP